MAHWVILGIRFIINSIVFQIILCFQVKNFILLSKWFCVSFVATAVIKLIGSSLLPPSTFDQELARMSSNLFLMDVVVCR